MERQGRRMTAEGACVDSRSTRRVATSGDLADAIARARQEGEKRADRGETVDVQQVDRG